MRVWLISQGHTSRTVDDIDYRDLSLLLDAVRTGFIGPYKDIEALYALYGAVHNFTNLVRSAFAKKGTKPLKPLTLFELRPGLKYWMKVEKKRKKKKESKKAMLKRSRKLINEFGNRLLGSRK